MRNFARYLLLGGLAAGCTINNVESGNTGGSAAVGGSTTNTGGTSNTGGKSATGGTTAASSSTIAGSSSVGGSSNAGGTSAAQGGLTAAGGSTPTAGTTGVGGSSQSGGTSGNQGGSTSTGGASSSSTAGAGGTTGGGTSTTAGGATASGGAGGSSSTTNQIIKLNPNNDECDITADTTWGKAVYDLSDCGSVAVASALTIQAGTIVKFPPGGGLYVQGGTIVASGTLNEPIVFTSMNDDAHGGDTAGDGASTPLQGDWGLTTGDVGVQGSGSKFNYVQFLYGSAGLRVDATSVEVKNCTFAHNSESGMLLTANAKSATVTGNVFFDNDGFPLRIGTFVSLDATNVFHDPANAATKNTMQCIELVGSPTLDTATTIGVTELAFYGEFVVSSSLTLSANNVCFKCSLGQSIALNASGTIVNGANAVFTSALDDSIGGDCLGDGDLTPSAGDWDGIWVDTGSTTDWASPTANIRYTDQANNPGTLPLH